MSYNWFEVNFNHQKSPFWRISQKTLVLMSKKQFQVSTILSILYFIKSLFLPFFSCSIAHVLRIVDIWILTFQIISTVAKLIFELRTWILRLLKLMLNFGQKILISIYITISNFWQHNNVQKPCDIWVHNPHVFKKILIFL